MHTKSKLLSIIAATAWLLLLAACGKATPAPTAYPPTAAATRAPTGTPSPAPTATKAPPSAALILAPEARAGVKQAVQQWLQALAEKKGYALRVLSPGKALPQNVQVVVSVGVAPPKTTGARRIAVNPPPKADVSGAQALSTTSAGVLHRAFLAGYLAAVVTKDWRVGILADASEGKIVAAFKDGVRYYCGLCRPLYPPFFAYPQFALVPAGAKQGEWATAARELVDAGKVHTLAFSPVALQSGLENQNLHADLIAIPQTGATVQNGFAASVEADVAAGLDLLWQNPKMQTANTPMKIRVLAAGFISPGRLRWVMETQKALAAGLIAP